MGLAKQHLSSISFEYQDDAVPLLSHCRFTGSEVRPCICVRNPFWQKCTFGVRYVYNEFQINVLGVHADLC